MSLSRSARLEPLQVVADQREDEAMRAMAECQRLVTEHENRLKELQRYLQDYLDSGSAASTPALINNRHAFLAKLRDAEKFQSNLLEQAKQRCEAERARWLLKRRDVGVLEQLAASYRVQERQQQERVVQRDSDERASQSYFRAMALNSAMGS
jgi:flagellar FliJ protein